MIKYLRIINSPLKLLPIILIFSVPDISAQQVVVNLQAPPPYQMRIEDMWNLVLINQGKPTEVYLHGVAREQNAGLITDVSTSVFYLPVGIKRIRSVDVGTVTINQSNQNFNSVINRLSALPNGNYEICIDVIRATDGFILGTGCIQHEVLNLSQVELLYPENNSVLDPLFEDDDVLANEPNINQTLLRVKPTGREGSIPMTMYSTAKRYSNSIVFSWLPPTPLPASVRVTYRIKIVELIGNQSPYDAMQSNPMFFSASGIMTTSFQYPVAAREFNPEREYAWQVEAYAGDVLLTSSEIYSFVINDNSRKRSVPRIRPALSFSYGSQLQYHNSVIRAYNNIDEKLPSGLGIEKQTNFVTNSVSFKNNSIKNSFSLNLLPGLLLNKSESSAIRFSVNSELFGETSNRKGTGSEIKPSYGYLQFTPSVSLYGIPFGLNILLSSENSTGRQNINSFSFIYNVDAAKEKIQNIIENECEENVPGLMKFFSYFNLFGIGTNYPTYSEYTLNGVPVSGLSFEFNPGWFYIATAFQKNQKPIENSAFRRDLYSGRIGVGQKDDSHLFFTGTYANDDATSIRIDSLNRTLTPNSNYVFGIEGKINFSDGRLSFDGEIAGAMLTRDNRDPDLINNDIPQFVTDIFHPKISSQVDYAYTLNSNFNNPESNTRVTATVKMIGPGYKSLGNPTLRNDKFEVSGRIDQKFAKRQVSVSLSMKFYRDNLINSKLFTTKTYAPGIKLGLKFKGYPFLNLSYNPSFLMNDATDPLKKVDFQNHLFTASTGYNNKIADMTLSSNLFYMFNKSKSLDSLSGYTSNNFTITENLSFKSPLVLSVGFGMNFMDIADFSTQILNIDGSVGYTFFEQWNNSIGVNYSVEKDKNNRIGFYLNSSYILSELVSIDLRIEKNNYTDLILNTNDYDEIIARSTLKIQF